MARYCFYCGRELAQGERCNCRDKQDPIFNKDFHKTETDSNANNKTSTASGSSTYPESETAGNSKNTESFFNRFKTKAEDRKKQARKSAQGYQEYGKPGQTSGKSKSKLKQGISIMSFIHALFTRPSETIRNTKQASLMRIVITNLIAATIFALLIFVFASASSFARFAFFQRYQVTTSGNIVSLAFVSMLKGFFAYIILATSRILITYFVLRFIGRQRQKVENISRFFLAGTYYEIIIMLVSLMFISGRGLRAIIMLIAAFAIRSAFDYISLKTNLTLSEDKLLVQFTVIQFVLFVLLSFLINFSVPNFANFDVLPSNDNDNGFFAPNVKIVEEIPIV